MSEDENSHNYLQAVERGCAHVSTLFAQCVLVRRLKRGRGRRHRRGGHVSQVPPAVSSAVGRELEDRLP